MENLPMKNLLKLNLENKLDLKLEERLLSLKSDLDIVSPDKLESLLEEIKNVEKKIIYVNKDVVQKLLIYLI